jgi:phospholipase/carboxylesterase
MNQQLNLKLLYSFVMAAMLVACQNSQTLTDENIVIPEMEPTLEETTPIPEFEPTVEETMPISEIEPIVDEPTPIPEMAFFPLPQRTGLQTQTSGTVPHVQIGVNLVPAVNDELYRLAFALPEVENRPTIVSLPGARGMWLSDELTLIHPEVIVSGREFAHIHPDGSLHLPLPYDRALEAVEKGWAERHPWADERDGWKGFVMVFTPQSMAELDVVFQLILDSYNFVTGRSLTIADLDI